MNMNQVLNVKKFKLISKKKKITKLKKEHVRSIKLFKCESIFNKKNLVIKF